MKKQLAYWLASKNIKLDNSLKRKLLIGAGVLGLFFFIGIGVFAYVGIKAASYLIYQVPSQEKLEMMAKTVTDKTETAVKTVASNYCLQEMKSLLNLDTWLQKPVVENTRRISNACWGVGQPVS